MDEEANNNSPRYSQNIQKDRIKESILLNNQDEKAGKELDDDDGDEVYSPKLKKLGTARYARKRRPPLYVYTFKVNQTGFPP